MELSMKEFSNLSEQIYTICGIEIKEEKHYLIKQRLEPVVRSFSYEDFSELNDNLTNPNNHKLRDQVISAITTNETFFFRDRHYFESFRDHLLPRLGEIALERKLRPQQRRGAKVKIWCAASSTGQEPYSIAMLLHEYVGQSRAKGMNIDIDDFSILATDISPWALSRAMTAEYNDLEISRGLEPHEKKKYFVKNGCNWALDKKIQSQVQFRRINLMESFDSLGSFDFIFCRNVLIYFDNDAKEKIFRKFCAMLTDEGGLMIGSTENTYGFATNLKTDNSAGCMIYRPDKTKR